MTHPPNHSHILGIPYAARPRGPRGGGLRGCLPILGTVGTWVAVLMAWTVGPPTLGGLATGLALAQFALRRRVPLALVAGAVGWLLVADRLTAIDMAGPSIVPSGLAAVALLLALRETRRLQAPALELEARVTGVPAVTMQALLERVEAELCVDRDEDHRVAIDAVAVADDRHDVAVAWVLRQSTRADARLLAGVARAWAHAADDAAARQVSVAEGRTAWPDRRWLQLEVEPATRARRLRGVEPPEPMASEAAFFLDRPKLRDALSPIERGRLWRWVENNTWTEVATRRGSDDDPVTATRIGGEPYLEDRGSWPRDAKGRCLDCVLQVDLAEMPLPESPLPRRGVLGVFARAPHASAVLFHADPDPARAVAGPPDRPRPARGTRWQLVVRCSFDEGVRPADLAALIAEPGEGEDLLLATARVEFGLEHLTPADEPDMGMVLLPAPAHYRESLTEAGHPDATVLLDGFYHDDSPISVAIEPDDLAAGRLERAFTFQA